MADLQHRSRTAAAAASPPAGGQPGLHRLAIGLTPWLLGLFSVIHFALVFVPELPLGRLRAALCLLIILCGLVLQGPGLRGLTLLLLAGGLLAALFSGFTANVLMGFANMASMSTIIYLAPVAGFLYEHRPYGQNLLAATRRWLHSLHHLQMALMILTHVLAAMVGLASLAIIYPLMRRSLRDLDDIRAVSVPLLRGYASTVYWAPGAPLVAMALDMLKQPLYSLLPVGLLMVAVFMAVSLILDYPAAHRREALTVDAVEPEPAILREFGIATVIYIAGLSLADHYLHIGLLALVPLYSIAFTLVAFTVRRELPELGRRLWHYGQVGLQKRVPDLGVVLAAGFFLASVEAVGLSGLVQQVLGSLGEGGYGFLLLLPVVVVVGGYVGIPPTVGSAVLITVLAGQTLPVPAALMVAALGLGVATIHATGPISIPTFLLSSLNGQSLLTTGMRWNLRFGLIHFVVAELVLLALLRLMRL